MALGRDSDTCDYPLLDPRVSRRHAVITSSDGRVFIKDAGSSNGTWVNGQRITQSDLSNGDVIHIGHCQLSVRRYRGGAPAGQDQQASILASQGAQAGGNGGVEPDNEDTVAD
jgi:pSer/pThr/pTyr-binding forkhead associated (FHA) protein